MGYPSLGKDESAIGYLWRGRALSFFPCAGPCGCMVYDKDQSPGHVMSGSPEVDRLYSCRVAFCALLPTVMFAAKSPPKGKNKEEWHMGWWDFQPLVEQLTPRSVSPVYTTICVLELVDRRAEWSNSSVIFTPHPTQPTIQARHFSSSKQFNIPSPAPILAALTDFNPPTVISVSPNDDWLFAYFPGRGVPGVACLWCRGPEIDSWKLKDHWTLQLGAGVVTASWLGAPRQVRDAYIVISNTDELRQLVDG